MDSEVRRPPSWSRCQEDDWSIELFESVYGTIYHVTGMSKRVQKSRPETRIRIAVFWMSKIICPVFFLGDVHLVKPVLGNVVQEFYHRPFVQSLVQLGRWAIERHGHMVIWSWLYGKHCVLGHITIQGNMHMAVCLASRIADGSNF